MKIEIKSNDVMEEIYALSALQAYVELPEREKALLQEDQREGLAVLSADAFAETVMELMPRVQEAGMPEESADGDMWIELKEDYAKSEVIGKAIGKLLVKTIACMVLSAIYEESSTGEAYGRKAKRGIAIVRETIDSRQGMTPRLQGWR